MLSTFVVPHVMGKMCAVLDDDIGTVDRLSVHPGIDARLKRRSHCMNAIVDLRSAIV